MQDNVKAAIGASDGVYIDTMSVSSNWYQSILQCRHTSIVPVNCNGLERARCRGDIFERAGVDVSVSTI